MIQLLIMATLVVAFVWLQSMIYSKLWKKNLTVDLYFQSTDMFEGDEGTLNEVIVNDKWLPLPLFHIKFQADRSLLFAGSMDTQKTDKYYRNDVFQIGRHEKITRNLPFTATKRGYYRIDSIDFVVNDLFLGTSWFGKQETERFLYVYPKPFYSRDFIRSLQIVNGMMQTKNRFLEDPFEYRGIREYQTYDDMKRVNWKATAKTGDLKVNLRDYTAVKSVRIFLNLEDEGILKKMDCAEACIRIATGIAEFFLEKGMKVSCYGNCKDAFNGKVLRIEPKSNAQEIYRALACIDLSKEMLNFSRHYENRLLKKNNDEYTFVISLNVYEEFLALLQKYHMVSGDFIWFYPVNDKSSRDIPFNLRQFCKMININQID